jgi:hypothetical protein
VPRPLTVNRVIVHAGAVAQAIRLLRWWAHDASDHPMVVEVIKQSKECARDLAADLRRRRRAPR